ncbi:hypothetical protein ACV3R5_14645 [Clostridium perfringens]|uniref:hypothetical protein n=1 Tax=Clostridium perfringens TaxID=1502 RepID=UPI0039E8D012
MKLAIINGLEDSSRDLSLIENLLMKLKHSNYDIIEIKKNIELSSCLACNGCWIKTPGKCSINDSGHFLSYIYNTYDIIILISYIYFGSYSPWIKSILERLVPNILPYFEDRDGKMYHSLRNDKYPHCIFIGVDKFFSIQEELDIFDRLTYANIVNMTGRTKHHHLILDLENTEEDAEKIIIFLKEMEAEYEGSHCQL